MIFSLLRINELLGYSNEIKTYLSTANLEGLPIKPLADQFIVKHERALEASNRNPSSQYTQWLRGKDYRRDQSFIAFRNLMEACTHRSAERVVSGADRICRIIRAHGWSLYASGQKVQSAKMASLIKELDSEENQAVILSLKANDWYQEMLDDNTAYTQLLEEKEKLKANEVNIDTENVYKELRLVCDELFESITVLNKIASDPKYMEIADFCNQCTQKYITAGRIRKTKNENAENKTAETEA